MKDETVYRLNVLWVTDHCCYDGVLHAGGRLFRHVIPRFDAERFRIVPCMMRTTDEVRAVFDRSPVKVTVFEKGKFDATAVLSFVRVVRREGIDVMHLHCYGTATYGRMASWITGVPSIIHDYDTDHYFPYRWYLRAADRLLAHVTRGAIAATPLVRQFMVGKRRVDPGKIRLMMHPVLPGKFEPVAEDEVRKMRARLQIPPGAKVVSALTKLAPERGNDFLLRAAREVGSRIPGTVFVFVYSPTEFHRIPRGYSPDTHTIGRVATRRELEALAQELGIHANIRFLETVDVPDAVEACSDVIVAPFLNERFTCARLLEAMAKGKPLIATDLGEQREIVKPGVNGYRVEPGNVRELADRLVAVLSDAGELARLGAGGRSVAEEYRIDRFVDRLEKWYVELAREKTVSGTV